MVLPAVAKRVAWGERVKAASVAELRTLKPCTAAARRSTPAVRITPHRMDRNAGWFESAVDAHHVGDRLR